MGNIQGFYKTVVELDGIDGILAENNSDRIYSYCHTRLTIEKINIYRDSIHRAVLFHQQTSYLEKFKTLGYNFNIHNLEQMTKKPGHSVEVLQTYDLSSIDGIVAVGGDGIYHEILNGILPRVQKENGVDHNDVECNLVSPSIPIGLIPTGTGNGVANWCYGSKDIETAALHVIRGVHHKSSVLSVNVDGNHVVYGGLLFSYGIMSDIIKKAEGRRWMKVMRYPVSMIGGLLGRQRCCRAEVTYKTLVESQSEEGKTEESVWQKAEINRFISVGIFTGNMIVAGDEACVQLTEKAGLLMFYDKIGKMDHLKFWAKFATGSKDIFDLEWLHFKKQTTRFHIKVDQSTSNRDSSYTDGDQDLELYINVDGESIRVKSPDIHTRYCGQLISLYSTKFDEVV